jgi:hypothetical protein
MLLSIFFCLTLFFIYYIINNSCFEYYANNIDYEDALKSKYYTLKGNKDEKSLISKIQLYQNFTK